MAADLRRIDSGSENSADFSQGSQVQASPAPQIADLRLRELAEIGLAGVWLAAASLLGYDRFLALWRHLSADEAMTLPDGQVLLRLRDFGHYERLQRDLYIRRLVGLGFGPMEIHQMVRRHLGDERDYRAVKKVAAASWARKRLVDDLAGGVSGYLQERMLRAAEESPDIDLFPKTLQRAILAQASKAPRKRKKLASGNDVRLRELLDIGLSASWVAVARLVGYDDFVSLWRMWSAEPSLRTTRGTIELRLRSVRQYDKYQRNRYIETLVASGLKPSEIHAMVRAQLGENMSFRHLSRLVSAVRVPA